MSDPVFCDDCEQVVRLERNGEKYALRCGCGKDAAIPETWRFETWR